MTDYSTWFVYDVMGDLVCGKWFDCMTSSKHRHVPKLTTSSPQLLYWVSHMPMQPFQLRGCPSSMPYVMLLDPSILSRIPRRLSQASTTSIGTLMRTIMYWRTKSRLRELRGWRRECGTKEEARASTGFQNPDRAQSTNLCLAKLLRAAQEP